MDAMKRQENMNQVLEKLKEQAKKTVTIDFEKGIINKPKVPKDLEQALQEVKEAQKTQLIQGYWVDQNGNKWNCRDFDQESSTNASLSLTNCYNCIECENCQDCTDCRSCKGCSHCVQTTECTSNYYCIENHRCVNCHYSSGCKNSSDLKNCRRCENSQDLENCCHTKNSQDCTNCKYCASCTNCQDCSYCTDCKDSQSCRSVYISKDCKNVAESYDCKNIESSIHFTFSTKSSILYSNNKEQSAEHDLSLV